MDLDTDYTEDHHGLDELVPLRGFAYLGYDVMWNIASYCLDIKSIVRLGLTCSTLQHQVLDEDDAVWGVAVRDRRLASPAFIEAILAYKRILQEASALLQYGYDGEEENDGLFPPTSLTAAAALAPLTYQQQQCALTFTSWRSVARSRLTQKGFEFFAQLVGAAVNGGGPSVHSIGRPAEAALALPPWEGVVVGGAQQHTPIGRRSSYATPLTPPYASSTPTALSANASGRAMHDTFSSISAIDFTGSLCVGRAGAWVIASALKFADTVDTLKLPSQNMTAHSVYLLALAASGGSRLLYEANMAERESLVEYMQHSNAGAGKKKEQHAINFSYAAAYAGAMRTAPTAAVREAIAKCFVDPFAPPAEEEDEFAHEKQPKTKRRNNYPSVDSSMPYPIVPPSQIRVGSGFYRNLSVLVLSENKLGQGFGEKAGAAGEAAGSAIALLIAQLPQLTTLVLRNNALDSTAAAVLSKAIGLMFNDVQVATTKESNGSSSSSTSPSASVYQLSRFVLDENPIGNEGAAAMLEAFTAVLSRRRLHVGGASPLTTSCSSPASSDSTAAAAALAISQTSKTALMALRRTNFLLSMECCGITDVPQPALTTLEEHTRGLGQVCKQYDAAVARVAAAQKEAATGVAVGRPQRSAFPSVTVRIGNAPTALSRHAANAQSAIASKLRPLNTLPPATIEALAAKQRAPPTFCSEGGHLASFTVDVEGILPGTESNAAKKKAKEGGGCVTM